MNANDVYNIACALSKEEQLKLHIMLQNKTNSNNKSTLLRRKSTPSFSQEDAINYLLKNHFKL